MKRLSVLLVITACFTVFNFSLSAQSKVKLAHLNSNDLMQIMPGIDTAQKIIQEYAKSLEDELSLMYNEYRTKAEQFQKDQATMSQILQQTRVKEIQDLESRIRSFEEQAQEDAQAKQQEIMKPLIDRVKSVIGEVAKEHGYTYVFDSAVGILLYYDDSDDILELVKKKLDIK